MSDYPSQPEAFQPTSLDTILHELNETGRFKAAMLTSTEGLPIAALPANHDSDFTAAVVAMIQRASDDVQSQLGMANVDEVTIQSQDRIRLVCRSIAVGREKLILAVMVPAGRSYRRLTNRAARQIRQLLS